MTAVLFQQRTAEIEAWLAERRRAGLDHRDEVWEGTYVVMNPAPSKHHAWLAAELVRLLREPAESFGLRAIEAANVGSRHSYRIPDVTVCDFDQFDPTGLWLATAAIAIEIRSPGEAHEEKLPFYAGCKVGEVVLVDPEHQTVRWLALSDDGEYRPTDHSGVLDLAVNRVTSLIRWD